jgi:hypothetical protein
MRILPPGSFTPWWNQATEAQKRRYSRTIYVDMHHRGFSLEQPLFTDAVANCLVVAINRTASTAGTLAHINITQSGCCLKAGLDTVGEELERMAKSLGGRKSGLEVLLWKGSGFATVGNAFSRGSESDFGARLGNHHGFGDVIDLMDRKRPFRPSSSVLFDPITGIVYELSSDEATFVGDHLAPGKNNPVQNKFNIAITRIADRDFPDDLDEFAA